MPTGSYNLVDPTQKLKFPATPSLARRMVIVFPDAFALSLKLDIHSSVNECCTNHEPRLLVHIDTVPLPPIHLYLPFPSQPFQDPCHYFYTSHSSFRPTISTPSTCLPQNPVTRHPQTPLPNPKTITCIPPPFLPRLMIWNRKN